MGVSGVFSLHPTWIPLEGGTRAVGAPMTTNLSAKATLNEGFFYAKIWNRGRLCVSPWPLGRSYNRWPNLEKCPPTERKLPAD